MNVLCELLTAAIANAGNYLKLIKNKNIYNNYYKIYLDILVNYKYFN